MTDDETFSLKVFLEDCPIIYWATDSDGTITLSKGAGLKVLGLKEDELVGESHFEIYKDDPNAAHCVKRALSGESFTEDSLIKGRWFSTTYSPVFKNKNIIGMKAVTVETTKKEFVGQKESEKLNLITNSIPSFISYVDTKERYQFVNDAYTEWFGLPRKELIGKTLQEVLGDSYETSRPHIAKVLQGIPAKFETTVVSRSLQKKHIEVNYIPDTDAHGCAKGFVIIGHDFTETKNNRDAIQGQSEWLQAVMDRVQAAIILTDIKTNEIRFANKAAHTLTGGIQSKIESYKDLGIYMTDKEGKILTPEDYPRLKAARGEHIMGEQYTLHSSLGARDFIMYSDIVPEMHGIPDTALLNFLDITELNKATSALKQSEERLQLALESAQMGVWDLDLVNHKAYISEQTKKIFGIVLEDENLNEIISKMIHPDDQELARAILEKALKEKTPYSHEYRIIRADGQVSWVQARGKAVYDTNGNPISLTGISIDVSEQKLIHAQLQEHVKARDEFLSIASHELKTPLTSLMLQTQSASRKIRKGAEVLNQENLKTLFEKNTLQINRLVRLVDDMLDLSRVQSGKLTYLFLATDLSDLVRDVSERLKEQFDNVGSHLILSVMEKVWGEFDRDRIEQVITNLLTNALKYGNHRPVRVELLRKEDTAILKVTDQGIGISPKDFDKVFLRFERIISASEVSGLGIGLYITKQIVLAHRGNITVESKVGSGSCFTVTLPLTKTIS